VWAFVCHAVFAAAIVAWRSRVGLRQALRQNLPALASFAIVLGLYLPYPLVVWSWYGTASNLSLGASPPSLLDIGLYRREFQSFLFRDFPSWAAWLAIVAFALETYREAWLGEPAALLISAIVVGQVIFVQLFLHGRIPAVRRYYTPAFPLFWLVIAIAFGDLVSRPPKVVWAAAVLGLAVAMWAVAGPFVENAVRPLPRSQWRTLHASLATIPGRKVVFFDPGYLGQMLEYEARDDPEIVIEAKRPRFWLPLSAHWLDAESIAKSIEEHEQARCFFYYFIDRGAPGWWRSAASSPYFSVFLPEVSRRGYSETRVFEFARGFCKP